MKKMLKTLCLFLLVGVILFSFAACVPSAKLLAIYDDDERISETVDRTLSIGRTEVTGNNSFNVTVHSYTGVESIANVTIDKNPLIDLSLKIYSGEFKLVFVKDGTVFLITSADTATAITAELAAGEYTVKMVGKEVHFELKLDFRFATDFYFI
jgi:hypothetical protein